MSKMRNLEQLLSIYDYVNAKLTEVRDTTERVLREVYPKAPKISAYREYHLVCKLGGFVKHFNDTNFTFLVLEFAYSYSYGEVQDCVSIDWYKGPDDPRLIRHLTGRGEEEPFSALESLAWQDTWQRLVNYSQKSEDVVTRYWNLSRKTRKLEIRLSKIKNVIFDVLKDYAENILKDNHSIVELDTGSRTLTLFDDSLVFGKCVAHFSIQASDVVQPEQDYRPELGKDAKE